LVSCVEPFYEKLIHCRPKSNFLNNRFHNQMPIGERTCRNVMGHVPQSPSTSSGARSRDDIYIIYLKLTAELILTLFIHSLFCKTIYASQPVCAPQSVLNQLTDFHFSLESVDGFSFPSSAEVRNAWNCTSTPQYFFMSWCLVKSTIQILLFLYGHHDTTEHPTLYTYQFSPINNEPG
jgi:hypothetical protein